MKKLFTLALLFACYLSYAQVEKFDREIGMSGNFNAPTEGDGGNGSISVLFNQYFTPRISLGLTATFAFYSAPDISDPSGGNELKITPFIGPFFTFNFLTPNGKLLPYIGVEYTLSWIESFETYPLPAPPYYYTVETLEILHFAGGKAGMKIFITEMVNFDFNFKYQTLLLGPEGYNAGNIGVNFGLGVILPRRK